MKKNIYNTIIKKITSTSILFTLVILLAFTYIVCVYKTVTIASHYEKEHIALAELQTTVGEKEHMFIQKTSTIDVDTAIQLGYERSISAVTYIDTTKETELAVR